MNKEQILRLIDIKLEINRLKETDLDRKEMEENGSYASAEGYKTYNMERIEELEDEINSI